ncbi:MAG TPA: WcaI family glycosyltransferase [Chitinophagaceae bacterium]|nr:WcaI family glycosyltransferase [Chitinophagaceae bacterium]
MRILIYGINYAPELTGIGKYTGEMGAWLVQNGHTVDVITAIPYYPMWKAQEGYSNKWWHTEIIGGARIFRCPLYIPEKLTSFKRIAHEFSFVAAMIPVWFKTIFQRKYDIVLCVSPPFHMGLFPLLYTKIKGAKLVIHIQDLQVDAAKDLGMIKNRRFLNIMFGAEKFILRKSTAISTISPGMQIKIESKGIPSSKIIIFPNWVDEHAIKPLARHQSLRKEFGLKDTDKVILYSGNLGEKQGLEIILEVAKHFIGQPDIYFIITGSGGGKEKLETTAREAKLTNVKFFPLQPYEMLSALLATADIHLVLQKKSATDLVMPSKLVSILAAGGFPIVTAIPGSSLYNVIDKYQAGILIEPENAAALKQGIEKALENNLDTYKTNARRYAEQFLSKENIMKQWEETLKNL